MLLYNTKVPTHKYTTIRKILWMLKKGFLIFFLSLTTSLFKNNFKTFTILYSKMKEYFIVIHIYFSFFMIYKLTK